MAPKAEEIRKEYIANQIARLEVFKDFRMMPVPGLKEYRRWIENRVGDCDVGRLKSLIDECVMLEELPSLRDLSRIWESLYPPKATAMTGCPYCTGTGFEIVEKDGVSGARRCRCGGVPVADWSATA